MDSKPTYEEMEQRINELEKKIIEHKGIEKILEENEKKLKSTLASIGDLVFVLDKEGVFQDYYQPMDRPDLYAPAEEFLGKSYKDVMPSHVVKPIDAVISKVLTTETDQQIDYNLEMPEGMRWYSARISIKKDIDGAFGGIIAVVRDITDRRLAEEEREELIAELQEAMADIKKLSGLLPICSNCKKIRDDRGYWGQIEAYIESHSEAKFSHGLCPECMDKIYGGEDWYK